MTAERPPDSLADGLRDVFPDVLNDEIERALAVDPSPDFIRRVRTRIAEEQRPVRWPLWPLAGVAVAATTILAVYLVRPAPESPHQPSLRASAAASSEGEMAVSPGAPSPNAPSRNTPSPTPRSPIAMAAGAPRAVGPESPAPTLLPGRATAPAQPSRRAPAPPSAEVAGPGELAGVLTLLASVRTQQVEFAEPFGGSELTEIPIASLVVEPIDIQPLPDLALLTGERP